MKCFKVLCACLVVLALPRLAWSADVPTRLKCLLVAYRGAVKLSPRGDALVTVADGAEYRWTDGRSYDWRRMSVYNELLENTSHLAAMFLIPYRGGFTKDSGGRLVFPKPGLNEDAGRIRWEQFFESLYGRRPAEVEDDLTSVNWKSEGKRISFNKKFGAAASLQRVADGLDGLVKARPELRKFVSFPLGGTYNWRPIAGSKRRSVHSYGVAIDINTDNTDYWQWDKAPENAIPYKNRIPSEIADIFERNGFIWGAKWYRYDTMHFEFRPELMMSNATCESEYRKLP